MSAVEWVPRDLVRNILMPYEILQSPGWVDIWPATVESVVEEFKAYGDAHGVDVGAWDLSVRVDPRWLVRVYDDVTIGSELLEEDYARAHLFGHAAGIGPLPRPDFLRAHFTLVEHHRG